MRFVRIGRFIFNLDYKGEDEDHGMRFVRIGRFIFNLDYKGEDELAGETLELNAEEAAVLMRHLEAIGVREWHPRMAPGAREMGPRRLAGDR